MHKIVLDTNVIVSAMLSPNGVPAEILARVLDGELQIFYSRPIMAEYEEVLLRPKFAFDTELVRLILDTIIETGVPCASPVSSLPMPDETDRVFYDTARNEGAFLITGNLKHYPQESFIVTPREFLFFE